MKTIQEAPFRRNINRAFLRATKRDPDDTFEPLGVVVAVVVARLQSQFRVSEPHARVIAELNRMTAEERA
jgi:hypothetical protein